jgi:hypothetical protein
MDFSSYDNIPANSQLSAGLSAATMERNPNDWPPQQNLWGFSD